MTQCPKCYGFNVAHKEKQLHELEHRAKIIAGHGHADPTRLLVGTGAYLIGRAMIAMSPYVCKNPNCGHRFS